MLKLTVIYIPLLKLICPLRLNKNGIVVDCFILKKKRPVDNYKSTAHKEAVSF